MAAFGGNNVHVEIIDDDRKNGYLTKVKWSLIGQGAILLILGIICLAWPGIALVTVATMVGIGFLISGIASIAGFATWGAFSLFPGWTLAGGIVNVLLGILFLVHPVASSFALVQLVAAFVLVGGIAQLVSCWKLRKAGSPSWMFILLGGILTVVLGILMFAYPVLPVYYLAAFALIYGVILVVLGIRAGKVFG